MCRFTEGGEIFLLNSASNGFKRHRTRWCIKKGAYIKYIEFDCLVRFFSQIYSRTVVLQGIKVLVDGNDYPPFGLHLHALILFHS